MNEEPSVSRIIHLIITLTILISFQLMLKIAFSTFHLEQTTQNFSSFMSNFQTVISWIIGILIFMNICTIAYQFINLKERNKGFVDSVGVAKPVPMSSSLTLKNNQEKSNSSVNLDIPKKTIFRPNVDQILSMIQYVEDLQKQIKNSLNINKITLSSPSRLQLSNIDQSIFVKFNILKEKFMLDYQAVDWDNNINQEISNSYQKVYNKHQDLLQEEYDNIKSYLKDYLDHQTIKSEEILDLIKKIIN